MKVQIIPAKTDHIAHIAANIRKEDAQELWDYALLNPEEALRKSLVYSRIACTGMVDGIPVCMFGVGGSLLSEVGRVWMIGTSDLGKYAHVFLKRCQKHFWNFLIYYTRIENYVEESNTRAILWLKWLGFQFGEPAPMGPFNKPFIHFSLTRKQHAIHK